MADKLKILSALFSDDYINLLRLLYTEYRNENTTFKNTSEIISTASNILENKDLIEKLLSSYKDSFLKLISDFYQLVSLQVGTQINSYISNEESSLDSITQKLNFLSCIANIQFSSSIENEFIEYLTNRLNQIMTEKTLQLREKEKTLSLTFIQILKKYIINNSQQLSQHQETNIIKSLTPLLFILKETDVASFVFLSLIPNLIDKSIHKTELTNILWENVLNIYKAITNNAHPIEKCIFIICGISSALCNHPIPSNYYPIIENHQEFWEFFQVALTHHDILTRKRCLSFIKSLIQFTQPPPLCHPSINPPPHSLPNNPLTINQSSTLNSSNLLNNKSSTHITKTSASQHSSGISRNPYFTFSNVSKPMWESLLQVWEALEETQV